MGSSTVSEKTSLFERIETSLNVLSHIFIAFNTIFLTWICWKYGLQNTSLHAFLGTIGYHFLMAEAILCLYSNNSWTTFYSRQIKTTLHWILQVIGCTLGIVGAIVEIYLKSTHFTTIHGITGLTATILLVIGLLTGLSSLYAKNLNKYFKPTLNKAVHNFLGLSGYIIGLVSLYYAYDYGFVSKQMESLVHVLKIFTILTIVLTSIGPLKSLFRQTQNMINS